MIFFKGNSVMNSMIISLHNTPHLTLHTNLWIFPQFTTEEIKFTYLDNINEPERAPSTGEGHPKLYATSHSDVLLVLNIYLIDMKIESYH